MIQPNSKVAKKKKSVREKEAVKDVKSILFHKSLTTYSNNKDVGKLLF